MAPPPAPAWTAWTIEPPSPSDEPPGCLAHPGFFFALFAEGFNVRDANLPTVTSWNRRIHSVVAGSVLASVSGCSSPRS